MNEAVCAADRMQTLLVDPPALEPHALQVGSTVGGRYVIEKVIGRGGYGSVFEARHLGTGQGVAIKVLAHGLEGDEVALTRFFQEARVTSGLRHPNTVRVFDFGQDDSGVVFLAMELLSGVSLKQSLKERQKEGRPFTEREALDIGIQISRSLAEAHAAGLVHRDLKPDNIFLQRIEGDDVVVKVLDFGIVKRPDSSLTLGSDSGIPGTPAFMSPEQVKKRAIDGRSDLYSLGVVLYNLVTGSVPFRGDDALQTLYMHVHEPVPDVRSRALGPLSPGFARLIERCLSKEPGGRPRDAQAMRTLLEAVRAGRDLPESDEQQTVTTPSRREAAALFQQPLAEREDATLPLRERAGARPRRETEDPSIPDLRSPPLERPLPRAWGAAVLGAGAVIFLAALGLGGYALLAKKDAVPVQVPVEPPVVRAPPTAPPLERAATASVGKAAVEPPVERRVPAVVPEERPAVPEERPAEDEARAKRVKRPGKKKEDVLDLKI